MRVIFPKPRELCVGQQFKSDPIRSDSMIWSKLDWIGLGWIWIGIIDEISVLKSLSNPITISVRDFPRVGKKIILIISSGSKTMNFQLQQIRNAIKSLIVISTIIMQLNQLYCILWKQIFDSIVGTIITTWIV